MDQEIKRRAFLKTAGLGLTGLGIPGAETAATALAAPLPAEAGKKKVER